ncbi:MAG: hypothetical protein H0W90_10780 [Actinobacteria bacterium]|nr:hypothetical protein [Actinomycetota bacterium]
MKRFVPLLALCSLGLVTASLAVAKAPPGKGKHGTTTSSTDPANCHPKISVILKGTFVSGAGTSFTMDVTKANSHGRDLAGAPLTLLVDDKTKFVRQGPAKLTDFEAGDRLNVQARACKKQKGGSSQAPSAQPAAMLAKRLVGRPANPAESEHETTTTTSTP